MQNIEPSPHNAGHRIRRHLSFPARRFRALHLSHRRFRQDVDAAHRRQERHRRRRAHARGARRSRSAPACSTPAPSSACTFPSTTARTGRIFQLNLPATPVTDIKVAHKDLVLSTQGRSFWILDNLTPLHQLDGTATARPSLFTPRDAVRYPAHAAAARRGAALQYPLPGAQIDYYLAAAPAGDITLEILDAAGKVVRKFTSAGHRRCRSRARRGRQPAATTRAAAARVRSGPTRLEKTPGMHRFTWDLRYPGPWQSAARPEGPNGPAAVPGKYRCG